MPLTKEMRGTLTSQAAESGGGRDEEGLSADEDGTDTSVPAPNFLFRPRVEEPEVEGDSPAADMLLPPPRGGSIWPLPLREPREPRLDEITPPPPLLPLEVLLLLRAAKEATEAKSSWE